MVFVGGPTPGNPVAVVGIGVQTPAGSTPDELWAFLCAGRSCAEPFADPALPPDAHLLVARVKGPDPKRHLGRPQARRLDRIHLLATAVRRTPSKAFGTACPSAGGARSSAGSDTEPPQPSRRSTAACSSTGCVASAP